MCIYNIYIYITIYIHVYHSISIYKYPSRIHPHSSHTSPHLSLRLSRCCRPCHHSALPCLLHTALCCTALPLQDLARLHGEIGCFITQYNPSISEENQKNLGNSVIHSNSILCSTQTAQTFLTDTQK